MTASAPALLRPRIGRLPALVLIMLITAALSRPVSFAQESFPAGAPTRKFSIGFLPEGSDIPNATLRMEELRQYLVSHPVTSQTLTQAGFSDVILSPCDGPNDMVQRIAAGEFDLVLATAVVYARVPGSAYEPILQLKQKGEFPPPGQDSGVMRPGVIFVGPRSPLFKQQAEPTSEDLRRLLQHAPLAVPSADSAVGYLSPRYIMMHDLGLNLKATPAPLFCGSDSEVIKHVVAGLAEVGACRKGALEELFGADRIRHYVRVLRNTDSVPTDPILLRGSLVPMRSRLGVTLKRVLSDELFNNSVANASSRNYEIVAKYLQELQETRPDGGAAGIPSAPLPQAQPTSTPHPTPTPTPAAPKATPAPTPTPAPRPALPAMAPAAPTPDATPALPPLAGNRPLKNDGRRRYPSGSTLPHSKALRAEAGGRLDGKKGAGGGLAPETGYGATPETNYAKPPEAAPKPALPTPAARKAAKKSSTRRSARRTATPTVMAPEPAAKPQTAQMAAAPSPAPEYAIPAVPHLAPARPTPPVRPARTAEGRPR